MDSSIPLPGGHRIGWDGIIGLVPGIGDFTGLAISIYILAGAHKAGASTATMFRMMFNITIETLIGTIPIIGDIFDFVYKANNRNMDLLRQQLAHPTTTGVQSQRRMWLFGFGMLLFVLILLYVLIKTVSAIIGWIF